MSPVTTVHGECRRRAQGGSVTVLVVAMAGAILWVGAALGVATAMVRAHRMAQSAADLSALAGARAQLRGADACTEASRIAVANGALLTACRLAGETVAVEVRVAGPHWLGETADLEARARAGPA